MITPPKGATRADCLLAATPVGGKEAGQALLEACIVLAVFLLLWFAISWLGSLQDMGLAAQHAGRHAAFMHSRGTQGDMRRAVHEHFFSGPAHQWSFLQGGSPLGPAPDGPLLQVGSRDALPGQAQPGGEAPHAGSLRHGWALHDTGITTAQVSLVTRAYGHSLAASSHEGAVDAMGFPVMLRRHTSILTNAGHAENDSAVQKRVAASRPAWGDSAQASYSLAQRIADRMDAVDAAWKRPPPRMDWLDLWEGAVPDQHLVLANGGLYGR
jgi:hypothetical protein